MKNLKNKKASSTVFIIAFLAVFLTLAALAVDGTIIFTNRLKLQNITEMTALTAASEFYYQTGASRAVRETKAYNTAQSTFNTLKQDGLQSASADFDANGDSNKILVQSNFLSQPFFLAFLGVSGIRLEAKACAISEELPVTASYSGAINWLTASAAYLSDILSKDVNMKDTAILYPLGGFESASYKSGLVDFGLLNKGSAEGSLSLGPGGFITIKLPAPIVNKTGDDLYIKEDGKALEGYFVFAGIDVDPSDPYVQEGKEGAGIKWINISCSGTPEKTDLNGLLGVYNAVTENLGNQDKFYGSGYFDVGKSCITGSTNGLSMVKYIRIIDDNQESAFITNGGSRYYQAMLYGEASTNMAGADIKEIKVLNHVKLIPSSGF